MGGTVQFLYAGDGQEVGAHALYLCAHLVEKAAELLDVRFAGSVVDGGDALGQHGGHHDVGRAGDGSLVQEHIAAFQALLRGAEVIGAHYGVVLHRGAEAHHAVEVGVHPAAADLVAAGLGEECPSETAQERSDEHHGAAQSRAAAHEFEAFDICGVNSVGLEGVLPLRQALHLDAHPLEHADEILDVEYLRYIGDPHFPGGQEHCADDLQGLVLGSLRDNLSGQFPAAFYRERCHIKYVPLPGGVPPRISPLRPR